jgi:plasmid stability protein
VAGNIQIRGVPDPLHRKLSALALANDRTIAEEALAILEDALIEPSARERREEVDEAQLKKNEARRRAMIDWALR